MAVGPGTLPTFFPVAGVRLGIGSAGIKKPGKKDLVVIELAPGSRVAGIFTRFTSREAIWQAMHRATC